MVKDTKKHMRSPQIFNRHKQTKIFRKGMISSKNGNKRLNKKSNWLKRRKNINNIYKTKFRNSKTLIDQVKEKVKCLINNKINDLKFKGQNRKIFKRRRRVRNPNKRNNRNPKDPDIRKKGDLKELYQLRIKQKKIKKFNFKSM